ncbi:hypothetical protein QN354_03970 [Cryobacterium sp. 5I3]|uniref:hypothetical protein n=1 Tax=Cryobacterium sp. 5I3 TaxID=3048592 RepID=UPI002B22E9D3|nr:hypothetical protein [Cryobacterium sp. 5I3]MEB0200913.1 hypothetical protein [Cryobacterium sp. 5I3]
MIRELRSWPTRRRLIIVTVAAMALTGLTLASGTVAIVGGSLVFPGPWWADAVTVGGACLIGLVVASYVDAPIGADATLCDLRWPALGLISLYLSTDLRTAVPLLEPGIRPVVGVAAIALLVWALLARLNSEYKATRSQHRSGTSGGIDGTEDGEVCTTCRPLFPRVGGRP